MSLGTLPAWAAGSGTESDPLSGSISDLNPDSYEDTDGVVYIDGITGGYWAQGSGSDTDYALTIEANINIGDGGMTLTNGYSDTVYTFTGDITGNGDWVHTTSQSQKYIFTGDLSGYSGNITNTGVSGSKETYIHFGEGKTITADNENISGTGSIVVNGNVTFNYTDGDEDYDTSPTMKIGNAVIEATTLEFAGSVNYDVSSDLEGHTTSSTLTISTEGTVTLSGTVSNFSSITVNEGSTLVFTGTATIGAINNSGTVILNEGVTFTIDGVTATYGSWSSDSSSDTVSVTYTLISGGGDVTISDSVLASLGLTSSVHYVESVAFTYADGVLTAEVTGLADGLHGSGTADDPYYTTGDGTIALPTTGDGGILAGDSSTTVYIGTDDWALGSAAGNVYWASGSFTAECNIVIGAAGIYLTNGTSGNTHTFTGAISGEGSWTINTSSVNQDYVFTGDLSGWSGDFTITGTSDSYVHYGDGATVAAKDTNVSGTGAVSVANGTIVFNYVKEDEAGNTGPETVTIGNSSLTAANIEFAGNVNYVVSEGTTITGTSSSGAFTVSTEGAVTILGTFSNSTFGSLTVAENSTFKIGADNAFYIGSTDSNALYIAGTLEVAEGVEFTISKNYASTGYSIANLVLGDGSSFVLDTTGRTYGGSSSVPHETTTVSNDQGLAIGTLTVTGSATISTSTNHNYISIDALIGEDATLNLGNTGQSIAATIYELTGNGESSFTGTITLFEDYEGTDISYYQGVTLIISDEYVAAGAVINMGYEYKDGYTIALGVNAERVEVAGLTSDGDGAHVIYSGSISSGANIGDRGAELDDYINHREEFPDVGINTNTLVINVAEDKSYEFTGNILDKVNIEKTGAGSQSITFQRDQWQTVDFFDGSITVLEGTLSLSSESGVTVTPGEITVAAEATLNFEDITLELSSAIENSGSITFSDTTFVLDSLESFYNAEYNVGYYEVVINSNTGNVDLGDNLTFSFGGSELEGWNIVVADNGNVYIYGTVGDLTWAGTDPNDGGNNNWSISSNDLTWSVGEGFENTSFINESGATFGAITNGSPYATVNVVGEVTASSTTINDSYTFTTNDADGAILNTGSLTITTGTTSFVQGDGGSLTVNIDGLDMNSSASLEFSGETTNAAITGKAVMGSIYVKDGAVLDLQGVTSTHEGGSSTLYIDGGTVIVSNYAYCWNGRATNFGSDMYNGIIQISNGGVLEVTAALDSTDARSGKRGFSVTEGEGTYRYSGYGTSYILEDGNRTIHLEHDATLIFDVVKSDATLDVTMAIAYGMSSTSDVGSATTSEGSLVKTGAGKLILEAANNYSGGTKIKEGVLVAKNNSALGTGTISIEGGQLSINSGITISNSVNVTFSEAYQVASGSDTDGFYAIAGTGGNLTAASGVEITLFLDETMTALLISEGELYFALIDTTGVNSTYETDFSISLSDALSSYDYEYYTESGVVHIFATPEPSSFGLVFGISALALTATRRRRRRQYREAA